MTRSIFNLSMKILLDNFFFLINHTAMINISIINFFCHIKENYMFIISLKLVSRRFYRSDIKDGRSDIHQGGWDRDRN